ncbi:MAG: sulfur carrier protein ThiS [Pseudomonadota bacterium]
MINIILNGESKEIQDNCNATILLQKLKITAKRLAIEVNENILPRSQFNIYVFKKGDKVEIVHAIGGG